MGLHMDNKNNTTLEDEYGMDGVMVSEDCFGESKRGPKQNYPRRYFEGESDVLFFKPFVHRGKNLKGKSNVLASIKNYRDQLNSKQQYSTPPDTMTFCMDRDYDLLLGTHLQTEKYVFYQMVDWDKFSASKGYNDLECFMFSTTLIEFVLVDYYKMPEKDAKGCKALALEAASCVGVFLLQAAKNKKNGVIDCLWDNGKRISTETFCLENLIAWDGSLNDSLKPVGVNRERTLNNVLAREGFSADPKSMPQWGLNVQQVLKTMRKHSLMYCNGHSLMTFLLFICQKRFGMFPGKTLCYDEMMRFSLPFYGAPSKDDEARLLVLNSLKKLPMKRNLDKDLSH